MPLSITQEVEMEYYSISGSAGPLPSRQARAIIKVLAEHIERQDNHIRTIEDRLLQFQNVDYFLRNGLTSIKKDKLTVDIESKNG